MSTNSEEKLIKEGWKKQATYDDPRRLSEIVAMYEEIGLEVHLEPFNADNESGCTGCMQLMPDLFKTVYTRRKAGQGMTNDE
jgi:hypothetical protein